MIGMTVVIHAVALDYIIRRTRKLENFLLQKSGRFWKALILSIVIMAVFCAHIVEIWLWALLYMFLGAISGLEAALYFSTSVFTTVGFGDLVLDTDWRLLSSIESANGFMLFGWSTAFIFEIMSQLYKREASKIEIQK